VCHVDFALDGLGATSESLSGKLAHVDRLVRAAKNLVPHLIVFPEGAGCELLHKQASAWAVDLSATTVCGTSQMGQHVAGIIIGPDGMRETFYKKHLSPYDSPAAVGQLLQAESAGIDLAIPCTAIDGTPMTANVRVLICYDFRFYQPGDMAFNTTQMVVVPMHDPKFDEPELIASALAQRHYLRTFLVNKAKSGSTSLHSSAFGPLSDPQAKQLATQGAAGVDAKTNRIWQTNVEGVTLGEYEVAQYVALGHDTAYGGGFLYRVEHHPLVS
jgi:hypothetical protein